MAIGYLYIFLSATLFSLQFIFSKQYERKSAGTLLSNLWMSEFFAIWALVIFFSLNKFTLTASPTAIMIALGYTLSFLSCNIAAIFAMQRGKVGIVTLYMLIGGQALPFIYGIIWSGDRPSWICWVGFAVMMLSFVPNIVSMAKSGKNEKSGGVVFVLLCLFCLATNGIISICTDINAKSPEGAADNDFLILVALMHLVLVTAGIAVCGIINIKKGKSISHAFLDITKEPVNKKRFIMMFSVTGAYTLMNGFANVCSLNAASTEGMHSSVQFPILCALIIILTPVWARIFFHEKLSHSDLFSLSLAAGGVLLYLLDFVL